MQQQTRTSSNLSRLNTDIFVRDCERMQMQDIVLAGISMTDVFTLAGCHGGFSTVKCYQMLSSARMQQPDALPKNAKKS